MQMTCQFLVVFHRHEGRDGRSDVHHFGLLVRSVQCGVPLVDELACVCFFGQVAYALVGGKRAQELRKRICWGLLRLC